MTDESDDCCQKMDFHVAINAHFNGLITNTLDYWWLLCMIRFSCDKGLIGAIFDEFGEAARHPNSVRIRVGLVLPNQGVK